MLRAPAHLWRLARVGATLERTGAMSELLEAFNAPARVRLGLRLLTVPGAFLGLKGDPDLPPVPRALTALGPSYVKFGQVLSTRPDVAGEALAREMRVLQDKLPPFDDQIARKTVEEELEAPIEELFSEFGPPVAAASIAQVHQAVDRATGDKVAVKILRPGIERAFRLDIDAFYFAARLIERLAPAARRLRPTEVVRHFDGVVTVEMDLRMEASAASEFRANTLMDVGFDVPEVVWPHCSRRVLTTGWVDGAPMGDVEALNKWDIDLPELAERMIQMFLRHALRDGFFHADMHQGNLKVDEAGAIISMDFGIMGRIDPATRRYYAEILLGFLSKNYRRVAEVHFEAGYVPADKDVAEFAQALRSVGEPIFGQDASRISMGRLLAQLFEVTERFGMETRTELILLQRTMVVVEGVSRSLDPHANMWRAAEPVVEGWMRSNLGPEALLRDTTEAARILTRLGPHLPGLAERLVSLASEAAAPPSPPEPPQSRWGSAAWLATAALAGLALGWILFG